MSTTKNTLLVKQLIEFGLSEKEAEVYLALLELEIAVVSEISKTANINRSSTYVVLESLKRKGLVSVSGDKKVQRYVATSPEMLSFEAQNKAKKAEDIRNKIGNIVPELKALHKDTKHRPVVRMYEGKQGLINVFEDSLNSKEKIMRVASNLENVSKILSRSYLTNYVLRRINLGIKMYGIHPDTKIEQHLIKVSPKFDEPMLISQKKYRLLADTAIWDNKIGYMSSEKGGFCISIESKGMSDVMKNIFDLAYEEAKRLNKETLKTKKQK